MSMFPILSPPVFPMPSILSVFPAAAVVVGFVNSKAVFPVDIVVVVRASVPVDVGIDIPSIFSWVVLVVSCSTCSEPP